METEFELMIANQGKALRMALGGVTAICLAAVGLAVALRGAPLAVAVAAPALLFAGGFYGLLEWAKRSVGEPTLVVISPREVRVLNRRTGLEKQVPLAEIVSYQHVLTAEAMGLHLRLKNGQKVQLGTNTTLYGEQDFDTMVGEFERALDRQRQPLGEAAATLREKTFFEKRISTIIMAGFSALLAVTVVYGLITQKPLKASSFTGIAAYIGYATSWYAARKQRQA